MEESREFQEWELLQNPEAAHVPGPDSDENSGCFDGTDGGSEGVIRSDYFIVASDRRCGEKTSEEHREKGLLGSDNSRKEMGRGGIETKGENLGAFGSDLGENGLVGRKFVEFEGKSGLSLGDEVKNEVGFDGIGEIQRNEIEQENSIEFQMDSGSGDGQLSRFDGKEELDHGEEAKMGMSLEGIDKKAKNSGENLLDSGGNELDGGDTFETNNKLESSMIMEAEGEDGSDYVGFIKKSGEFVRYSGGDELVSGNGSKMSDVLESSTIVEAGGKGGSDSVGFVDGGVEFPSGVENAAGVEVKSGDGEKKGVVWWKLPFEFLKICSFRVSPVWSFSIAAAVVGFVILRRRLSKMRPKSRNIPLKVNVDDKKVSQIMVRVARLNEAFSVVKRVPIIRSSLPGTLGVTPWPVMSLR